MSFWDDRANELGLSQNTAENHVSSDVPRRQQASPSSYSSDEYYRIYGPQPEDNKPSQFKAGLLAGWDQLQAMGGGLQAMAGQAFDKPDWVDSGIETYNRNMEEAANRGATETSFTDLFADDEPLTFGRAADWAAYTVGNLAPTMASMLVSGGVGSLAAKEIIKRGSAKAIQALAEKRTAQLVASGVAKEAAEKEALKYAVKHTTAKAAEYGMMTGAGAGSVAMETGSIAGDMQNELGQIDTGTALIHGTAAGLFDALPFMRVMRQMGIAGIARKEIIDSIPKTILKTALAEGGTEAAQTIIERHAIKWLDDSKDIFTDDGWKDIIDSAAAGFLGGGVMGAPAAVAGKRANPEDDITDKLTEDADGPDPAKVNINRYQAFLDRAKGANDKRHATAAAAKQAEEDKKQFGIFTQRLNLDDQFGAYDDQEFRLNSIRAARESARAKGGDQLSQAIAGGEGLLLSLRNSQRSIEPAPLEGELLDRQNALPNLPPQLPGNGFINGETQPAGLLGTPPNFYMGGPIAGNRNNGLDQQATVANRSDNLAPQLSMKSFADNLDWTATKARRTARLPVNLQDQRLLNESYRTALTELAHNAQTTVKSNPNSRSVDIHSDDLLTAIAKLGGVDRNELAKDGVDLEDMKKVRRGIRPVFSVKGRSLDDLAETLAEDGYLNSRDVNELDSKIRDMLAGQAHYSNARDPSLDIQSDIASEANQSYDGRKTHSTVLNATDFDAQPAAVQDAINKAMNGERLGSAQARIVNEALEAIKQARSGVIDRAKLFRDAGRTIRRELKRSQDLLNRPNAPIDAYSEAESTTDEQGISPEDAELMLMIAEAQDAGVPDHVIDYLEASTRNDQDFLSGIKREIKRAAPNGNRQSESETKKGGNSDSQSDSNNAAQSDSISDAQSDSKLGVNNDDDKRAGSRREGSETLGRVVAGDDAGTKGQRRMGEGDEAGRDQGSRDDSGADAAGVSSPRSGRGGAKSVHSIETGSPRPGRRTGKGAGRNGGGVSELGGADVQPGAIAPPSIPAANFVIDESVRLGQGGEVEKFNDNLNAIRIVKTLLREARRATPDEQRALARYVGWGGLANAFADADGNYKKGWEARGKALAELLSDKELAAARRSTRNAHYTSETIISAMYDAVKQLGHQGGLMLEPSAGTGNFIGLAPSGMDNRVIAVEYDPITAKIAEALYPQATVLHSGFQKVPLADGAFDLVIGNPPFGSESLRFPFKPWLNSHSIHNQFFIAAMDALKPNGVMAMVVSRYLLDAQSSDARKELARRGKLLGAIRLPDSAFKENARTEVVTDIIFMQRHDPETERLIRVGEEKLEGLPWLETVEVPDPQGGDAIRVNAYFAKNPHMILGSLERSGSMRVQNDVTVKLAPGELVQRLSEAVGRLPKNVVTATEGAIEAAKQRHEQMSAALQLALAGAEQGAILREDGQLVRVNEQETPEGGYELVKQVLTPASPWSSTLELDEHGRWYKSVPALDDKGDKVKDKGKNVYVREVYQDEKDIPSSLRLGESRHERLLVLAELRDTLNQQLQLEADDESKAKIEANRKVLAKQYKDFVQAHGPINANRNLLLLTEMPDGALLMALEKSYNPEEKEWTGEYKGKNKTKVYRKVSDESAVPADILAARMVFPYKKPAHAETPTDALAITLAEGGRVNLDRIAELLGMTPEEAKRVMYDDATTPLIFPDPESGLWETRDAYLSGNVARKLRAAKESGDRKAVEELVKVQPAPIKAENVAVQVSASWVPDNIYADFLTHLTGGRAQVKRLTATNSYSVSGDGTTAKAKEWGTERASVVKLVDDLLNNRQTRVIDYDSDGKAHPNQAETELANLKRDQIASEFNEWVFMDGLRRAQLVEIFNELFNTRVTRQHDGSHLILPGKVPDTVIKMRRHQLNAIWRGISERFILMDHAVGAGKTFTAIARAIERKRMGLSRKPMVVVPNHMVEQFAADALRLYPGANVLAAGKKGFEKKKRRKLFARIATGDWDLVIVPHSSFEFIPLSPETEERYLMIELEKAIAAVKEAEEQAREDDHNSFRKPFNVKEAERMKESVENRLDKLRTTRKDRLLTFEQMGVDDLTVDEAHEFKNLFYHTRTTGVRGMGNKAGSQKAFDLYNKVRVLADSPTGSVAFLTGTPISNSAVEMYTIMRYLAGKELQELGLDHFDAWRAQFVGISTKYEPTENGRLKEVNRLGRSWSNMKSLMDLYQGVADMVSNDDIKQTFAEDNPGKQYPLPKVKGGKRQSVVVKPTQAQEKILKQVLFDYDLLDSITNPEDRNRERLRLMDRARKLSLDARAANPGEKSPEEGGKLDAVADNVAALYKQWNDERGTQLVFLDRSVPSSKGDKKVIKAYGDLIAKRDQALADNDETAYRRIIERLDAYNPDEIESLRGAQSGGWNAYEQIKQNLIKRGIPEKEIRFIQEANTDQQKQELFDAVNEGSVRVLIGSTPRMGAGTNVQKRLVGLHHVDVTWKPSDIEQREGRIIRQGNLIGFDKHGNIIRPDFEVSILAYVTERTMDAKMWDLNSTKLAMINAIRQYNGEFTMEFDDSESDAVNMEEIAALATGDPKMLERVTLKGEIDKLMLLERAHRRKQWGYADALREYERIIETYPDRIHAMQENIGRLQDAIASVEARSLARSVTVQGKNIHLRFDAEREIKGWIDAQQAGNPKARYSVKVNGKNLSSRVEIDKIIQSAFGDQGFEVLIGKREYISALDAGREIGAKLSSLAKGLADGDQSRSVAVGVMYGMTLEVDVMRDGNYFASLSLTDKAGAVVVSTEVSARNEPEYSPALIKNALSTLVSEVYSRSNVANLDRLNRALENAKKELPETKEKYGKPFDKAAELQEKRDRLAALTSELASEKVSAKAEEAQDEAVTQASVGSLVDADKPSFTAIARDELEQAIAPVLRQTGQTVKIVDSYHELPPAARAKVAKLGGLAWDFIWGRLKGVRLSLDAGEVPKLVPGVYHEGTYYAIREFTPNAEVSARTALHELVGHKGVNRVLGDEAGKIFRQIARSMPDAMREELKARYNLKDTDADLAELGSEYVAKLSEEDARPTTVQFVVAKIRHILRKLFPKLSWNKADALYLIERGRKALEKNSAEMDARETAAMESFDKAEGLANATPFSQSISDILSKQSDTAKDKVLDALLDNKFAEGFKKSSLALLTLRQLGDVAKKILPQINTYVGVVHEMLTDRNQMAEQAANIVDAWQAWAAKNRKEADKLADLMHAATIDGVDPSLAFESMTDNITKRIGLKEDRIAVIERKDRSTSGDGTAALMNEKKKIENEIKELKKDLLAEPGRRKRHAALVPEWNTLTPEAKQFYKKARDEYGKQNERMLKILQARIQGVDLNGTTIDGATKKRLLAELRLEFEAQRIQVYFPLSRFGKYYLDTQDKDGKRVYLMFETEREQQRVMKEMEKQGYDVSKHGHMLDKRREESASLSFIKELSDSIDNLAGYDVDEKDTIRDSIYQVYLRHLPDRSIRKAHIHRKKVSGYSTDAIRAFADTMMKNAYQLARLQRMDELSGLMTEMEQAAGPKSSPGNAKGIFYNEMQKRHEWVMNPKHSAIAHKLTRLGFIWMLGVSPAAAAINLTQTPVVAGPVLASKYGKGAWSELLRASRLFNVKSGSMLEKLTDQKERDAFNRWRDMGLLDSTRAHDLAGIAEHGGYEYSPTQHKIMTGISALFHRAEQFNREVTALAAFRLAMKKHNDYEQAVKEAAELTWDSHFDYSNVNRARFMQSGFMKVATQFKQYSQNITYYMLRNLHQMIKGESAEVKKQARQQLLGTLAMTGLIGGINALPLWALYAVANAIFGDDDEPYDAQTELYTYLSDTLGKDMADEIIYGAGGAGVSPRISLSGLWFRDSNRELEGEDAWSFYAQQAVGPVLGGIVPGFFEGMRKAGDGEYARAFENFVPKFVKDAAKTVRYFREGALNTKGDELKAEEDFSMVDLVLQLSGFADSDVSKQYAENAAIKGYERHILERRKRLMTKYYLAQKDGDSGEKLEVQQMIARFNKRWPEIRIDNKALRNSIKSRERARDNAQHGININPKLEQSLSRIDWAN